MFIILCSCKESKASYEEPKFNKIDYHLLKTFNAENAKFSLLFFSGAYFNSKVVVHNGHVLESEDSIITSNCGPFAKIFKIKKSCKTSVLDPERNYFLELNADSVMKYKFIYISREVMTDSLTVLYRNNHLPVKWLGIIHPFFDCLIED